jgi:hypothetical protein
VCRFYANTTPFYLVTTEVLNGSQADGRDVGILLLAEEVATVNKKVSHAGDSK